MRSKSKAEHPGNWTLAKMAVIKGGERGRPVMDGAHILTSSAAAAGSKWRAWHVSVIHQQEEVLMGEEDSDTVHDSFQLFGESSFLA